VLPRSVAAPSRWPARQLVSRSVAQDSRACARVAVGSLCADGASDTVKSDFLRAHFKKEKAIRVAQWRENETMGGEGDPAYETMRATRFSDLNRSMRFQGRKLSPPKSRRSRSPSRSPSHRHSSMEMYSTGAASNGRAHLDRTQPNEIWPVQSAPSVEAVVGGGRQPVGQYGRDSVTGTHTVSQPNLSYSPPNDAPEEPFIPVLLAPRRSPNRVSDVSRRQYDIPAPGTQCVPPRALPPSWTIVPLIITTS
jgi:hypothetical protein